MSTVADKLAKKSTHRTSAKQVRLRLVYIDFWSAVKLSFLAAIAIAVVTVVSFVLVFFVLQDQLASFGPWYLMLLGALAIVVMLFFRKGLWGTFADRYDVHLFPIRRRFERLAVTEAIPGGR